LNGRKRRRRSKEKEVRIIAEKDTTVGSKAETSNKTYGIGGK
jgi:hypothetical protein